MTRMTRMNPAAPEGDPGAEPPETAQGSPRRGPWARLAEGAGWLAAGSLALALAAGIGPRPASGVPVHDSSAISKLASQLSTLGRQIQQLTRTAEIVDGIRDQIGTIAAVSDFKAGSGALALVEDVDGLPWLEAPGGGGGGGGGPPAQADAVDGLPWLDGNGGPGAPGQTGQTERTGAGAPPPGAGGRPIEGPRGEALSADRAGDMPEARAWAARNFFLPPGEGGAAASRDLEAWRDGVAQSAAVEAWAQATAAREHLAGLPERQERIARALEEAQSLREDVAVLVAAISESTRAVAAGNAMAAAELEVRALSVLRGAPPVLSPDSRRALLGEISGP